MIPRHVVEFCRVALPTIHGDDDSGVEVTA